MDTSVWLDYTHIMLVALVQIYVEIERARLTSTLAKIREDQGNITEAATILQELQVNRNISYSHVCNCTCCK